MKNSKFIFLIAFIAFFGCTLKKTTPIDDLLNRIGGIGTSTRISTAIVAAPDGKDYFTITSDGSKPQIIGNNYLSVATGIHWYLKYYAHITLTWNQLTADLSKVSLPVPATAETHNTDLKYRYYQNSYVSFTYTTPFWDWEQWQKGIDWMALHGINTPVVATGMDIVWYNVLTKKLGYTKAEANAFVSGSAYQPFFLLGTLEGWGGPNSDHNYAYREVLQKQILARMHELGMQPIFPGYAGLVPHDAGTKLGWDVVDQGKWGGFTRPGFLLPTDPNFNTIAKYYYDELKALYGTAQYYSMDLFLEGGNMTGIDISAAYKALYNAMKDYSGTTTPKWVIQSWQISPVQEALDALEPGTLVVLDLWSDGQDKWRTRNSYRQSDGDPHEFVFCMVHNFGGRTGLHGRLEHVINEFYAAKTTYPNTMLGLSATMEGMETNPVIYEAFYELPWRANKFAAPDWMNGYVKARYGSAPEEAKKAWALLLRSVYNCPKLTQEGTTESVLCARPALVVKKVSCCSNTNIYWDVNDVRDAAALLLSQSGVLQGSNYEYDVVDVVRQTVADYANGLLKQINMAHTEGDKQTRDALADHFLQIILAQDKLVSTIPNFLLGKWIRDARNLGSTTDEKDLYEKNARMIITTWGDRVVANDSGLHEYSYREWGGLLKDFYYPRWKRFFDDLKAEKPTPSADEFFDMEWAWVTTPTTTKPYPATAQGDPIAIAKEMFDLVSSYIETPFSIKKH